MSSSGQQRAMAAAVGHMHQETATVVHAVLLNIPSHIPRLNAARQALYQQWGESKRLAVLSSFAASSIERLDIRSGLLDRAFGIVLYELASRLKQSGSIDPDLWNLATGITRRFCQVFQRHGAPPPGATTLYRHNLGVAYEERLCWQQFLDQLTSVSPADRRWIVETLVPGPQL